MSENAKVVRIVSPGEFMKMKRRVLVWTVITKDMRENGFKSIEPQFTLPTHLADDDICHVQEWSCRSDSTLGTVSSRIVYCTIMSTTKRQ